MNSFVLLGIILGVIGEMYLGLAGILVRNDKLPVKKINKSIIARYYGIMTASIISMVIGIFAK